MMNRPLQRSKSSPSISFPPENEAATNIQPSTRESEAPSGHTVETAHLRFEHRASDGHVESSDPQARILLTSLRNVIVPLVQTAMPNAEDLHNIPLGHEAEDLLVALQKYISCIIHHQSEPKKAQGTIQTVNFGDSPSQIHPTQDVTEKDDKSAQIDGLPNEELRNENQALLDMALIQLREHVFNEMPIRLLCFKKCGSKLDITMLDRAGIYSYLAPKLKERFISWRLHHPSESIEPMRNKLRVISECLSGVAKYAILSHTWLRSASGEVTYGDWQKGVFDLTHPGYLKLANFCRVTEDRHGICLGWMDTVCIDKSSSSELDESIRSMYKWYQKAEICIIYLAEAVTLSDMAHDPWFTRGWTLQELLAPDIIKFYGSDWRPLVSSSNDKDNFNISRNIDQATTIKRAELVDPSSASISRKMQWAAKRKVTRGEDTAYSLMGIFNVSMSTAYGEGAELAFIRLIKEILSTSKSEALDIFNWAGFSKSNLSALIPSSPQAYLLRSNELKLQATLREPLMLTHLGLRIPVLLLPSAPSHISTPEFTPIGDYYTTIDVQPWPTWDSIQNQVHLIRNVHNVLDAQTNLFTQLDLVRHQCLSFAVLNCGGDEYSNVLIPRQCLAIALLHTRHVPGAATTLESKSKVSTAQPIIFQLKNKTSRFQIGRDSKEYDLIQSSQLARHGMQLVQMYL